MNRRVTIYTMVVSFLVLAICPRVACGIEEDRVIAAVGVVEVTTDEEANIVAVKLVTEEAVRRASCQGSFYNIFLDSMGMKLGREMAGETVQVTGTVFEVEHELWMAVHAYVRLSGEDEQ